jgi:preprotein translocase SecE subunit
MTAILKESKKSDYRMGEKKKRVSFFRQVQEEMKKVSWTTKEELKSSTKIVIAATFALGLGIYIADLLIRGGLEFIRLMFRLIGG